MHKAEIVFNPNYENTTGSASPNFKNILMQNLTFLTEGTVQFTGTSNNGTVFPLQVTLDNVNFVKLQTSDFGTTAAGTAPTNASLTYGPARSPPTSSPAMQPSLDPMATTRLRTRSRKAVCFRLRATSLISLRS